MTFANELAQRAAAISLDDSGDEAIHIAKRAVADTLGVTVAGAGADFIASLETVLGTAAAPGKATRVARNGRSTMLHAALVNGTAAHALDFDDCSTTLGGHPSAPMVPALLAIAEDHGFGGKAVIEAYLAGFETETRLARGLLPHHYEKGWHPTATLGVFGATVASARLLGLEAPALANALAMTVSMTSGLKSNFGTPVKPLHVGQAAHNGMLAALLTSAGVTANLEAFEHAYGFFNVLNGEGTFSIEKILDDWHGTPEILKPGIAIKQHPCCGSAHSAIDSALKIRAAQGALGPDGIAAIETWTHERRLAHTNRPEPATALDAKFSVQFLTAKALTDGQLRIADFREGAFMTPAVAELLKVTTSTHHTGDDQYLGRVRVTMKDGRVFEEVASTNFGRGPLNPMTDAELFEKFSDCVSGHMDPAAAQEAFDAVLSMDVHDDVAGMMRLFA
ncbi:MmgE/PrpD family protein [Tropicimonas sp. IMCC34043]|uniref:MmgE/PrpD family protein n=1 Tax=Tropicimonas sp. IMCC34043 TaxID=2248760 RepID=UPI000E269A03|nr:MmgE/PrpD family protein [Tropicimonas sp. IMCC34043]